MRYRFRARLGRGIIAAALAAALVASGMAAAPAAHADTWGYAVIVTNGPSDNAELTASVEALNNPKLHNCVDSVSGADRELAHSIGPFPPNTANQVMNVEFSYSGDCLGTGASGSCDGDNGYYQNLIFKAQGIEQPDYQGTVLRADSYLIARCSLVSEYCTAGNGQYGTTPNAQTVGLSDRIPCYWNSTYKVPYFGNWTGYWTRGRLYLGNYLNLYTANGNAPSGMSYGDGAMPDPNCTSQASYAIGCLFVNFNTTGSAADGTQGVPASSVRGDGPAVRNPARPWRWAFRKIADEHRPVVKRHGKRVKVRIGLDYGALAKRWRNNPAARNMLEYKIVGIAKNGLRIAKKATKQVGKNFRGFRSHAKTFGFSGRQMEKLCRGKDSAKFEIYVYQTALTDAAYSLMPTQSARVGCGTRR